METITFKKARRSFWIDLLSWLLLAGCLWWTADQVLALEPNTGGSVRFLFLRECWDQGWGVRGILSYASMQSELFLLPGALYPFARARRCRSATLLFVGFYATALEGLQFLGGVGTVCFDDILLAELGACIGYQAFLWICSISSKGYRYLRTRESGSVLWLLYLVLVVGLFWGLTQPDGQALLAEQVARLPELLPERTRDYVPDSTPDPDDPLAPQIYDQILEALSDYQSSITLRLPLSADADLISVQFQQVCLDHPELFWLSGSGRIRGVGAGSGMIYTLTADWVEGVTDPRAMDAVFRRELDAIAALAADCPTDYEKALLIHDYLVQYTTYDSSVYLGMQNVATLAHTAYGCIIDQKAVCSGYAGAYLLLMDRLGVPCGLVTGMARNAVSSGPHAWNYICIDGQYSYVDVTWDDPVDVGGSGGYLSHDYFCISPEELSLTHTPDQDQYLPPSLRLG